MRKKIEQKFLFTRVNLQRFRKIYKEKEHIKII